MVDSERIRSGNVRPTTPSAGDLHPVTTVYLITKGKTVVFYVSTYIR